MITSFSRQSLINFHEILKYASMEKRVKIADFGCGQWGYMSFLAANYFDQHSLIYAVDIQKNFLKHIEDLALRQNISNIKTIHADLEDNNEEVMATSGIDAVLLVNALHQMKNKRNVLKESLRVLKTNGRLILVDWRKYEIDPDIFDHLGFSRVLEFNPGNLHYGFVLTK